MEPGTHSIGNAKKCVSCIEFSSTPPLLITPWQRKRKTTVKASMNIGIIMEIIIANLHNFSYNVEHTYK